MILLSKAKVVASQFSGFGAKEKWDKLSDTAKFYLLQSPGTLLMSVDGIFAHEIGTALTGGGNTLKNAGFFPLKHYFEKKFTEPTATLLSDTVISTIGVATNTPQLVTNFNALTDIVTSGFTGDIEQGIRGMSGLLAVSAYGTQLGLNASKLADNQAQLPAEKQIFPFNKVSIVKSKLKGLIPKERLESVEHAAKLSGEFLTKVGENVPGPALGARALITMGGGVLAGNPLIAAYGAIFTISSIYKGRANKPTDPSTPVSEKNNETNQPQPATPV